MAYPGLLRELRAGQSPLSTSTTSSRAMALGGIVEATPKRLGEVDAVLPRASLHLPRVAVRQAHRHERRLWIVRRPTTGHARVMYNKTVDDATSRMDALLERIPP